VKTCFLVWHLSPAHDIPMGMSSLKTKATRIHSGRAGNTKSRELSASNYDRLCDQVHLPSTLMVATTKRLYTWVESNILVGVSGLAGLNHTRHSGEKPHAAGGRVRCGQAGGSLPSSAHHGTCGQVKSNHRDHPGTVSGHPRGRGGEAAVGVGGSVCYTLAYRYCVTSLWLCSRSE